MSEGLHPRVHPDADALNAFVEGVLPEHERLECLAHLADCTQCREVVFLAQKAAGMEGPARVAVAPAPVPFWRRLLRPVPLMSMAAMAIVLLSFALYRTLQHPDQQPIMTAATKAPAETPPVETAPVNQAERHAPVGHAETQAPETQPLPQTATPPPAPAAETADAFLVNGATFAAPTAGVTGTISDPAGAIIAGGVVELKNENTGVVFTSASDAKGEYQIAGLAPGRYDLGVTVPGFKKFTQNGIDLQPQQIARVDSALQVGASAESVTVTAEATLLKTESGELAHNVDLRALDQLPVLTLGSSNPRLLPDSTPVYALPDKSTPVSVAAKGQLVVAADSSGALFVSQNAGNNWTPVRAAWKGKVMRVSVNANGMFELSTDPASTWVSANGRDWSEARPPR